MMEEDFRKRLNPEQYRVMRGKDDERPFSGRYWDSKEAGEYECAACGALLFRSFSKFDAGTGWPSFTAPVAKDKLDVAEEKGDQGQGELTCRNCGSHVGYLFSDLGKDRYQANSAALAFKPFPGVELPEEDKEEKKEEQGNQGAQASKAAATAAGVLKGVLPWAASAAAGAVIGAAGGMYLCRTGGQEAAPLSIATSTPAIAAEPPAPPPIDFLPASLPRSTSTPPASGSPAAVSSGQTATSTPAPAGAGNAGSAAGTSTDPGTSATGI
jgi:peptide-methionine (R)-S-oxide reductase